MATNAVILLMNSSFFM